mgnify:FL=1
MLSPITATMELFKSFETSFPVRYQNTVSKKLQMFQSVGPEGDSECFSGEFWATKKAPESVPVGLG